MLEQNWTFGRKIGAGFAVTVAFALLLGVISIRALRDVVETKDRVISVNAQNLTDAAKLQASSQHTVAAVRGFLLTGDQQYLQDLAEARHESAQLLQALNQRVYNSESLGLVKVIQQSVTDYQKAAEQSMAVRQVDPTNQQVLDSWSRKVTPKRRAMIEQIERFVGLEQRLLDETRARSTSAANSSIQLLSVLGISSILLSALIATLLTRALTRQVGQAVAQVQSSSAELQAAAHEQATGAKQQSAAVSEITTTISELLTSSRQIAVTAQRVAQIAGDTASAARTGGGTVDKAHDSISGIRRQVDLVVGHMLDLGRKSQQIGTVLDIVSELSEQTNILAINATIEAAGAGDAGKRFGVVAEEIRKLADRVSGSTKEIRELIDDVRSAVNTTVMATESGSKAVDAGTLQYSEVSLGFKHIAGLVTTTTEAAREIVLSTKQQATAVEQVNLAISSVAQATHETEASCAQTLQTAAQLGQLSHGLLQLVQPTARS